MKSSRFIIGLVVIAAVQISILAGSQYWKLDRRDRDAGRIDEISEEVAEADAARVFSRALVAELRRDPDYELRARLLTQAKLQAIEVIRRSRASPRRVVMVLAKLDEIAYMPTAYSERWDAQRPQQRQALRPPERRARDGPPLTAEQQLMRDLDRQVVPRQLDDISRDLNAYGTLYRQEHPDLSF